MENNNNGKGMSIAALVLGIVSCVLAWFYMINIVAIICGIAGIVLAVLGKKKAKAVSAPTGIGTAGLVLSIIGLVLSVIGFFTCTVCVCACSNAVSSSSDTWSSIAEELENYAMYIG